MEREALWGNVPQMGEADSTVVPETGAADSEVEEAEVEADSEVEEAAAEVAAEVEAEEQAGAEVEPVAGEEALDDPACFSVALPTSAAWFCARRASSSAVFRENSLSICSFLSICTFLFSRNVVDFIDSTSSSWSVFAGPAAA